MVNTRRCERCQQEFVNRRVGDCVCPECEEKMRGNKLLIEQPNGCDHFALIYYNSLGTQERHCAYNMKELLEGVSKFFTEGSLG